MWWLICGLGLGVVVLGLLSTGRWAVATTGRAAALFESVENGLRGEDKNNAPEPGEPIRRTAGVVRPDVG